MSNRIPQNLGLPVGYSSGSSLPASPVPSQAQEIEEISLPFFKQPQPISVRKVASGGEVTGSSLKKYRLPPKGPFFTGREDLLKEVETRVQDGQGKEGKGLHLALQCTYSQNEMSSLIYLLNGLGGYSSSQEVDLERSLVYYNQGLEISKKAFGEECSSTALFMNNLGGVYRAQKNSR